MNADHDDSQYLSKEEQYLRLINDLKAIIEDTEATDVDLWLRIYDLECHSCGAHEDLAPEGCPVVFNADDEMTEHESFIIIDAKERSYRKEKKCHCLTTYTYICPLCGSYQTAIVQDAYDDDAQA